MAAANFVQEMRSMGEKLLLKLQKLPQAEPVEIVAFSVILLFTGHCAAVAVDSLQLLLLP
ncbi:Small integral membrane protein 5 [Vulpes lagopus]